MFMNVFSHSHTELCPDLTSVLQAADLMVSVVHHVTSYTTAEKKKILMV